MAKNKKEVVQEDTPAAATLQTTPLASKSEIMSMVVNSLAKMPPGDLTKWFHDTMAQLGHYADPIPDGAAAHNAASVQMRGSPLDLALAQGVKEDFEKLFEGNEFTDEFKTKAQVLFESIISGRVAAERVRLEEDFDNRLTEEVVAIREELETRLDEYLDYAAQEWFKENQVAIESALRIEVVEDFMRKLRDLFAESYIEVPEDRVDVVDELAKRVEELEAQLNGQVEQNLAVTKERDELQVEKAITGVSEGLALTQVEKLKTLVEGVQFDGDVAAYTEKLKVIKEAHFKAAAKEDKKPEGTKVLEETVTVEVEGETPEGSDAKPKFTDPAMARYYHTMSRLAK